MPTGKVYDITPALAAKRLGVHVDTLKKWADEGKLDCWRTPGGHRRFSSQDLERFQQPQHTEAAS